MDSYAAGYSFRPSKDMGGGRLVPSRLSTLEVVAPNAIDAKWAPVRQTSKQPLVSPRTWAQDMRAIANDRDKEAFARVFNHYAPRVKAFGAQLGGRIDAEELVQDVMLTIWRRAASYDPERAVLNAWIFAIARNRRVDMLRTAQRAEVDMSDPTLAPEPEPTADEAMAKAQWALRLGEAIDDLPVEQRDLLRRSYFDDKSHSVLADEMELPLGTVKSRLRLALARLRGGMSDWNDINETSDE